MYTPGTQIDPKQGAQFAQGEFRRIAEEMTSPQDSLLLAPLAKPPAKPRDGMVVLAVAPWNPGSGPGYYGYRGGAWRFLG